MPLAVLARQMADHASMTAACRAYRAKSWSHAGLALWFLDFVFSLYTCILNGSAFLPLHIFILKSKSL